VVFHEYVKGAVPPVMVTVAVPVQLPLHNTLTDELIEAVPPAALETTTVTTRVHPFASVTVTV
jgi:hypothetical protein